MIMTQSHAHPDCREATVTRGGPAGCCIDRRVAPASSRGRGGLVLLASLKCGREGLHDVGVELRPGAPPELGECVGGTHGAAVRAIGCHRVVGVADGDDPRAEWDVLAGELIGVAAAVPALVARAHDLGDR